MSLHINRFVDKIKSVESKNLKNVNLTIKEARDLHGDITKLLLVLHELQKPEERHEERNPTTKIEITGGDF